MNDFGKNKSSVIAGSILAVIIFACVFCRFFMTKDPTYMDLELSLIHISEPTRH